jgi:hypothetical protein
METVHPPISRYLLACPGPQLHRISSMYVSPTRSLVLGTRVKPSDPTGMRRRVPLIVGVLPVVFSAFCWWRIHVLERKEREREGAGLE